jgi:uncharacterized protein (TIGR03545 family)
MENKNTIEKKNKIKIPYAFKKPIRQRRFEKRFSHLIEHPRDREFFISCFEEKTDDKNNVTFIIRTNLTKDELKKLKELLKVIVNNRKGAIRVVPLVFAAAVITAIFIFFTVFANPLLKNALEMALEAAFEAKADVYRFRLSLIRFEISMAGITVADRDKPMTNLFQMGRTEIILKPEAVLRGKIYIQSIRADTIRFGTPRTVSGTLPGRPPREIVEKPPKPEGPPLVDLQNFDAMALLNQEFDKLKTPKLYDLAIETYNETVNKWQLQVENTTKKVEELRIASTPILNINVNNFNIRDTQTLNTTISSIRNTIQDVNNLISTVQAATNDVTTIISGLESDINTARSLEAAARTAITDDINHFRSYIDLGSGAVFNVLEPFIRDMLSETAEEYIGYGLIALEVLEDLKTISAANAKKEKPKREPRFRGRNVIYPTVAYPVFYLGLLSSDFTIDSWNWDLKLHNVSSDPDLTNRPVTLSFAAKEEVNLQRQVAFNGAADFRTAASQLFDVSVTGSGFSVNLGDQMNKIGIQGFESNTAFSLNLGGHRGGFSTDANINLVQPRIIDPQGLIADAVDESVKEIGYINLGIEYKHRTGQNDIFNITSNIWELLSQILQRTAHVYIRQAMEQIERALRQKIDEYIDGKFISREQLDGLLGIARGDRTAMNQLTNSLNSKKNELEQRLNDAVQQTGQAVQQQVQQVTSEVQQAGQELQQQAQQAAQQAIRNLNLPGR